MNRKYKKSQKKSNQKKPQQNKQTNKQRNINNIIYEKILISNLWVINSLKVDFTEFAWALFWLSSFYFRPKFVY